MNTSIAFDMLNEEQVQALNLVENSNSSFFLTGRAGTGKTTFLQYIQEHVNKSFIVVAPTGISAIIAGGVTIHSFFAMPLDPITKQTEFQINDRKWAMLRSVDTIIVDEVSMVRCDIIDGMDRILRTVMKNTQPFGGKQIIFSGDLYQLEPVFNKNDKGLVEFFYNEYNTESPYFYYAHVFKRIKLPRIEFRKVYRQNDEHFLSILDNVRSGCYVSTDLMMLNNTALRNVQNVDDDVLTLTARNETADTINANRLAAIDAPQFTYSGKVEGDFQSKRMPVQQELILKEGARVMFCRNDKDGRWVNGTTGTIARLSDDEIFVRLDSGRKCAVEPATWENVDYTYDIETHKLEKEVIGTYTQYPLKLAWAITIHKSQGMTFDRLKIDSSKGFFATGQLYVALSRARSLSGLSITNRIEPHHIRRKPEIDTFMSQHNNLEEVRNDVENYKLFNQSLILADYDSAAKESLRLMHNAIQNNHNEDAYYAAIKLMDSLFDTDILTPIQPISLLSGEDGHILLINTILSIQNGNYTIAVALADKGILYDGSANFYYLKMIALIRLEQLQEALTVAQEWCSYLREQNEVVDVRCRYSLAKVSYLLDKPFMTDMQSVIRHCQLYVPAYELLRQMMHKNGYTLETSNENRNLVDVFNANEGNLTAAWRNSEVSAKRVLCHAILNFPYDE